MAPSADAAQTLRVSFVCTGNRARSPLAEALLRRQAEGLPVEVGSFGVLDAEGWPPLPEAAAVASALGLDLGEHRSRPLRTGCLRDADLVIGFELVHLAAAVERGGADPARVFALLELPELLEELEPEPGLEPVEAARRRIARMHLRRPSIGAAGLRELPDPIGGSKQEFAELGRVLQAVVGLLAATLFEADL